MELLTPVIKFIADIINNFGWAVVIAVALCYAITIPFKILSIKNSHAKRACAPEIAAIRKKYNANAMGVAHEDTPDMPPEIRKMSHDERDEAMANEISAVYKAHKYNMWTGWIPGFLTILSIIFLYAGIRAASPEGVYTLNWELAKNASAADSQFVTIVIVLMLGFALLTPAYSLITGIIKAKRNNTSPKSAIIGGIISAALSVGLSLWIASSVTTAIAIAMTSFYALAFVEGIVTSICYKGEDKE